MKPTLEVIKENVIFIYIKNYKFQLANQMHLQASMWRVNSTFNTWQIYKLQTITQSHKISDGK
jgi:hypothetical protein